MPINVDWLGDGWTYYTNEERKLMEAKNGDGGLHALPGWERIDLPAGVDDRCKIMAAVCMSLDCIPMPQDFVKDYLRRLEESKADDQVIADVRALIKTMDSMRSDQREIRAIHDQFRNN
jgi:hypothetical protein